MTKRFVTRDEFFRILYADPRDIMPTCEREQSIWFVRGSRAPWGVTTPGYLCTGPKTYAVYDA